MMAVKRLLFAGLTKQLFPCKQAARPVSSYKTGSRSLAGVPQPAQYVQPAQYEEPAHEQNYQITRRGVLDRSTQKTLLHLESRVCCKCSRCWNKYSNQISYDYTDETVRLVEITGADQDYIDAVWSDGHQGKIATSGRAMWGNGEKEPPNEDHFQVTLRKRSHQEYWSEKSLPEVIKKFDWEDLMREEEAVRDYLAHFMKHGLCFLKNVPKGKNIDTIVDDDLKCGPIWHTIFGGYSEVKSMANPTNEAYSSEYLPAHIDLPYYTQPPSAYFFYCIASENEGGESIWVDSFTILERMRQEYPDYFEVLARTEVAFRAYSPGLNNVHVTGSYPTVELTATGDLFRVRDLFFARDNYRMIQDLDEATREKWWEAYMYFRKQIDDPQQQLKVKLQAQEMVIIDNWRVFHGRHSFKPDPNKSRLMQVAYVDWNHLQSRVLYQK